ncbi:MAG TPA: amylo-alpha-1,6-glucosidase [Kofleriaceae bacterium]|nr:amylo-alpha-1,6-glucosidase [Kofleriaceae bacterium]
MTIPDPIRTLDLASLGSTDALVTREWLVTNGLGGYASGTVAGVSTRRYHGLLVAALPNPLGRVMMLNYLAEQVRLPDGQRVAIGWPSHAGPAPETSLALAEFALEAGMPVWVYRGRDIAIERRIVLPHGQNTVFLRYRLLEGSAPVRLELRPLVHFRGHDDPVSAPLGGPYVLHAIDDRYELSAPSGRLPPLRLHLAGRRAAFMVESRRTPDILYAIEESRGYESRGHLYTPGQFRAELAADAPVALVGSTEPWETIMTLTAEQALEAEVARRRGLIEQAAAPARQGVGAELVLAADQFLIDPVGRLEDHVRARATGDEVRTVIAGYHWFTDWGRDTMISLEGLTLTTGRAHEAGSILRTFAHYVRDGLIPNMFPEGASEGLYHTADATLWFFHALHRYVVATGDLRTLRVVLPRLSSVIQHHVRGTKFGIGVDPADGLLRQGAPGYQLTWMDAKAGDWVVTPRRGKAVEINALWYNALRLMEGWLAAASPADTAGLSAGEVHERAEQVRASFNRRFWSDALGHLIDVVDGEEGDDAALRPNQLFAISLDHPVLEPARWPAVLGAVERALLTPAGLRSLSPGHPDYKPTYHGDLLTRDAAYHQGTVWSWLIGPYVDARLRVHPEDRAGARAALEGLLAHLSDGGVGTVSEVFDAEAPFTPRGCAAQAWGVAELLRCFVATAPPPAPR